MNQLTIDQSTDQLIERVAGGLAGALLGDAMGSATEGLTISQIKERFGWVTGLLAAGAGTFADGWPIGGLTDDGLVTLQTVEELIKNQGYLTPVQAGELLVRWASDPEVFRRFAGPSSRKAILALRDGADPRQAGAPDILANDFRISNGAAMKVAPAGWFFPNDIERAVDLAVNLVTPTHNSHIAFAGAGVVAAAVSIAAVSADMSQVVKAALLGAKIGECLGLERAIEVPAPSMPARVELAIQLAHGPGSPEQKVGRLNEIFGSGLPITEAVPMAVGLVTVLGQDPMELIRATVNLGSDADTVAMIAGVMAGTYSGLAGFDPDLVKQIETTNQISIREIASKVVATIGGQRRLK